MDNKFNESKMEEIFFEASAMIGITSRQPAYRLCWLINEYFDYDFCCEPEMTAVLLKKENTYRLPVFQYQIPDSSFRHILYKLKGDALEVPANENSGNGLFNIQISESASLLPEIIKIDYAWLIQTACFKTDAQQIADGLRKIAEVDFIQVIDIEQLKNLKNLIV